MVRRPNLFKYLPIRLRIFNCYLHDLISIKDQKYNFRHQDKAVLPRVRTTRYGLNSFRYNAAQIWNELPNLIFLKCSNDVSCLKWFGSSFQICAALYRKEFKPYLVVRTLGKTASVAWHFCSEKNTKKIEKIQERARRFIYEDYENTYEIYLKNLNCPIPCCSYSG
jgi:hypothetical protein